jgi:D-arabinose 1-dehydrogenase-like Zn-dependent alcohol dehydrogenase
VCGFCHGGNAVNQSVGAFGEIITVKGDVQIEIPSNLSYEEAATLGVGITTVGQGLYQSLELPLPNNPTTEKTYILVYGGSTATGSLAIQFAKLSGLTVGTTCSPGNFEYVKSLGSGKFASCQCHSIKTDQPQMQHLTTTPPPAQKKSTIGLKMPFNTLSIVFPRARHLTLRSLLCRDRVVFTASCSQFLPLPLRNLTRKSS